MTEETFPSAENISANGQTATAPTQATNPATNPATVQATEPVTAPATVPASVQASVQATEPVTAPATVSATVPASAQTPATAGQTAPAPAPATGQTAPAPTPATGQTATAPASAPGQTATAPAPAQAPATDLEKENAALRSELQKLLLEKEENAEREKGLAALEELTGSRKSELFAEAVRRADEDSIFKAMPLSKRYEYSALTLLGEREHNQAKKTSPIFARSSGAGDAPALACKVPDDFDAARENALKYFGV